MDLRPFIQLDWRNAPKTSTVKDRISKLLQDLDQNGEALMTIGTSNAGGAVVLHIDEDGVAGIRRRNNPTKRKFDSNIDYFFQLFVLCRVFILMQSRRNPVKARSIAYNAVEPKSGMTLERVRQIMNDLALTIKVHPSALGIVGEASGKLVLPSLVEIRATCVTNADRDELPAASYQQIMTLQAKAVYSIPDLVLDLQVVSKAKGKGEKRKMGKVDAVVVVEHRNMVLDVLGGNRLIEDVIFVFTGGFPDASTKEFLHLMSRDPTLAQVPFLYFSDHDPSAFCVFQCLKYGSRTSAWCTSISICPQLIFAGPTLDDFKDSVKVFRPIWEEQRRASGKRVPRAQIATAANQWERTTTQRIEYKLTELTKKDKEILVSIDRLGWLAHEDLISAEITKMR
ncbi:MAG: hypothetical protein Q9212_006439 [Teloschistes hypoglaucus]